jgi:dynein heavy chain
LEILGQAKEPEKVMTFLKKMFEGIQSLDIDTTSTKTSKVMKITHINSPPPLEKLKLIMDLEIKEYVESWLTNLEERMQKSLQKEMVESLNFLINKKSNKNDGHIKQWILNNKGQLLITTGQIIWTRNCTKVLTELQEDKSKDKNPLKKLKSKQDL